MFSANALLAYHVTARTLRLSISHGCENYDALI